MKNIWVFLFLPVGAKRISFLFYFIKNRVWDQVGGWNGSGFSASGKEVLLKAVVQAIPSHVMACFKLLKKLIRDLHKLIADFWWGSKGGKARCTGRNGM